MIAVVPVRAGRLPAGADAAVLEAHGRVLVVGEGTSAAAAALRAPVSELATCEAGSFAPASWSEGLATVLAAERCVVLPGSPDGRDLAGRLAGALGRTCHAWCVEVTETAVVTSRLGGAESVSVPVTEPIVATLVPRPVPGAAALGATVTAREVVLAACDARDAAVLAVGEVDPTEVDLADATRILAGGMGLGGVEQFGVLARVAELLGASLGATRPVADRGIVEPERQIGTTGVLVDPTLYVAFGISGAVQHTAGLGRPERIVAVNVDAACPMMQMADLAIVADAAATAAALERVLGEGR